MKVCFTLSITKIHFFFFYGSVLFFCTACTPQLDQTPERILQNFQDMRIRGQRIDPFKTMISVANCSDPEGQPYQTEMHSAADGYHFFHQSFPTKSNYGAVIYSEEEAFQVDDTLSVKGALDAASIYVIKSHDFQGVVLAPDQFFTDLTTVTDTFFMGQSSFLIEAKDVLGHSARLFFNRSDYNFIGWEIQNPFDLEEQILVIHQEWQKSSMGRLLKRLAIRQGAEDWYEFEYKTLLINDPKFTKKALNQ